MFTSKQRVGSRNRIGGGVRTQSTRRGFRLPGFLSLFFLVAGVSLVSLYLSYRLLRREDSDVVQDADWDYTWGPSKAFCSRDVTPLVCAHGGDTLTGEHPNTVAAITRVPLTGAQCVEIDVSRTMDSVLVATHARDLAPLLRPGQQHINVGDFLADMVLGAETGTGDHVPLFEDAVRAALESDIELITVDYKPGPPRGEEEFAADVMKILQRVNCGLRCQAWSKDDSLVYDTISIDPDQQTGYVVMNETAGARERGMAELGRVGPSQVAATHYSMVDAGFVSQAHRIGQQVHTWTVNDVEALHQVLEAAVDAIVTNHPRTVQTIINSLSRQCMLGIHDDLK